MQFQSRQTFGTRCALRALVMAVASVAASEQGAAANVAKPVLDIAKIVARAGQHDGLAFGPFAILGVVATRLPQQRGMVRHRLVAA